MIGKLLRFIKINFRRRMFLYETGVLSLTLSGSFPNLLVRFASLGIFLISSILLIPHITSLITSSIKYLFLKKIEANQNLKKEVDELAKEIGVKVKKVRIVKGLCNAFVSFGTLNLGEKLLERLGSQERKAVIAHELAHIKEKHVWLKIIASGLLLTLPLWSWQKLFWPILFNESITQLVLVFLINTALLFFVILAMIPVNWYLEVRADRIAEKTAGKAALISAFLKLVNREQFKEPSENHPAISERVKLILKYNPRNGFLKNLWHKHP